MDRGDTSKSRLEALFSALVAAFVALLLTYGWITRNSAAINPEHGIGYALGIVGGSMMLLLLVYPLRKRVRVLAAIGSVGFWFRFHMLLGLLGPIAILYHSRYSWGALNSAIALGAMLVVSGSGLIGRFLYSHVHRGYSGRKLEMRALMAEMHDELAAIAVFGGDGDALGNRLKEFERRAAIAGASFWSSAVAVVVIGFSSRFEYWRLRWQILIADRQIGIPVVQVKAFYIAARRAAEFAFYDRMLRLWHLMHMPLFLILVAAATIHIIAVHMY